MSVEVLKRAPLTPQQILAGALNDPDLPKVRALAVVYVTQDDVVFVNWSHMPASELITMGTVLTSQGMKKLTGTG